MMFTLVGYAQRKQFFREEREPGDLQWVQDRQVRVLDQPDILRGDDGFYYVAPEGDPPPDLIPFDTLEAAVAAAIILSN